MTCAFTVSYRMARANTTGGATAIMCSAAKLPQPAVRMSGLSTRLNIGHGIWLGTLFVTGGLINQIAVPFADVQRSCTATTKIIQSHLT